MPGKGGHGGPPRQRNASQLRQQVVLQQQQLQVAQQQQQRKRQMQQNGGAKVEAAEKQGGGEESSAVPALVAPRSVSNLDRLMEAVAPLIEARYSPEVYTRGFGTKDADSHAFFYLEDLWESFSEWSVYGRGVPHLLYGEPIQQYYVPSLSGIQLHINPSKAYSTLIA